MNCLQILYLYPIYLNICSNMKFGYKYIWIFVCIFFHIKHIWILARLIFSQKIYLDIFVGIGRLTYVTLCLRRFSFLHFEVHFDTLKHCGTLFQLWIITKLWIIISLVYESSFNLGIYSHLIQYIKFEFHRIKMPWHL